MRSNGVCLSVDQERDRAERFLPTMGLQVHLERGLEPVATLLNLSCSGLACRTPVALAVGRALPTTGIVVGGEWFDCGPARVVRRRALGHDLFEVGVAFDAEQHELIGGLGDLLRPYAYVTGELTTVPAQGLPSPAGGLPTPAGGLPTPANSDAVDRTLDEFYRRDDPDLLAKCRHFRNWTGGMREAGVYQRLYRVTTTGALDHRITIFDPIRRQERAMRCFDSNSYLGLHRHPRVLEVVKRTIERTGYGTPSAQVLCGTNRYLRELEEKLSAFHGREDTIVFPTGYAANTGTIGALVRDRDALVRDIHAHASIHDGCRAASAKFQTRFRHNNLDSLSRVLARADRVGCLGKLVVTDGVFSMHGKVAPLPGLVDTCRTHGARLMIDDAHGVGVLGEGGHGIEEHFGMQGQVDILMGTLSKAVGCLGGYVTGSRDMTDYLRWFAGSGLFTTSLPAASCAGMREALTIIEEEPEHHTRMWDNARYFARALQQIGLITPDPESPIITVYIGAQRLLWQVSERLFEAGIKCGGVIYPAVAKNDTILRFAVTARHAREDLDAAVDALRVTCGALGMLGLDRDGLRERWGTAPRRRRPHRDRPPTRLASG